MVFQIYHNQIVLKGQNHQRWATPCDWIAQPFQALKGRNQALFQISPFQGLNLRVYPFHRALPDANVQRLSAFTSCLFFIPKAKLKITF
jgi:hypothetical protein